MSCNTDFAKLRNSTKSLRDMVYSLILLDMTALKYFCTFMCMLLKNTHICSIYFLYNHYHEDLGFFYLAYFQGSHMLHIPVNHSFLLSNIFHFMDMPILPFTN